MLIEGEGLRVCQACTAQKTLTEFYFRKPRNTYCTTCKGCVNARNKRDRQRRQPELKVYRAVNKAARAEARKQWYLDNKDKVRASGFKQRYGITLSKYDEMFQKQRGLCAICFQPEEDTRLYVDHNHTTKKVRGLLCRSCNFALGLLSDDLARLAQAQVYLQEAA